MGLTLSSYVVGTVAAATLIAVLIASAKSNKKTAADATGLSQTGGEGTTATEQVQPLQPSPGAPKRDTRSRSERAAAAAAAAAAPFDYTLPPELENAHCGLPPNDGHEWVEWVPPPRIKQSDLSKEETATFLEHIRLCFEEETVLGRRIIFDPHDVVAVCQRIIPYLASEQILIEDVPCGVTVVGDIHGQLHDLHRVFQLAAMDGKPGWECMKYLFLGDYVDRGRQSLECLMALFCLKMLYPDRIFLLRGNHEFDEQNSHYGFAKELAARYDDETALSLYDALNEVFGYLSLAAIIGEDRFFCAHAGISPVGMTRGRLNSLRKPILKVEEDKYIGDLVWSDPAPGIKGSFFNSDRGHGVYFGNDALAFALYTVDALVLVRGHTVLAKGYEVAMGGMCISLYTQSGCTNFNDIAVGVVGEDGIITIVLLECDVARTKLDKMQKSLDNGGDGTDTGVSEDEKTRDVEVVGRNDSKPR